MTGQAGDRSGLTLLELMVVLIILAIVATVAIRTLEPQINSQRLQSSSRLLDEIRSATVGPTEKYQLDGTPLSSGFVADVGCLPIMPAGSEDPADLSLCLAELWNAESDIAMRFPFEFRSGPSSPVDYSSIRLPCGWRGPYLQLAAGATGIVDPWGRKPLLVETSEGQVGQVVIEPPAGADLKTPGSMSVDLTTGKVDVTGTILLDEADKTRVVAVLLAPDPQTSLTTLVPIVDEDKERNSFLFRNVPIGFRAVVVDLGTRRQTKYIQVSHRGAHLVFDFRQDTTQ